MTDHGDCGCPGCMPELYDDAWYGDEPLPAAVAPILDDDGPTDEDRAWWMRQLQDMDDAFPGVPR